MTIKPTHKQLLRHYRNSLVATPQGETALILSYGFGVCEIRWTHNDFKEWVDTTRLLECGNGGVKGARAFLLV